LQSLQRIPTSKLLSLLPTLTVVKDRVFTSVYLCVCLFFRIIPQKPMQLGSPNLTQRCSKMSPGNSFILGSKGQRSRSRVTLASTGFFQITKCVCGVIRHPTNSFTDTPCIEFNCLIQCIQNILNHYWLQTCQCQGNC